MTFRTPDSKAMKAFAADGIQLHPYYIRVNGHEMHYVSVGADTLPTLIFVHGTPGSWSSFDIYMKDSALLKHYRMISVDRPGFGYSEFGKAMTLQEQSIYLITLANSLKNGKPLYLAGHSLGGPMVVKMAADAPDLFKGIMLISASVDPSLEPKEQWRYVMDRYPLKLLLPGSFRPSNTELVYFKEEVKTMADDLHKIKSKVYIVHGTKDSWVPPGNADFARNNLTNAAEVKTLMLEEGNHFIPWTRKTDIIAALIALQ